MTTENVFLLRRVRLPYCPGSVEFLEVELPATNSPCDELEITRQVALELHLRKFTYH